MAELEQNVREKLSELKNTNTIEKLVVMGCFSERYGDDLV